MANQPDIQPPRWAEHFFLFYCKEEELDILLGDLYEMFEDRLAKKGAFHARIHFIWEVITLFRPFAWKHFRLFNLFIHFDMFQNYLKISWRHLLRHKGHSFINITGLAIGLACCLIMFLYVNNEWNYDRYHTQYEHIYRITTVHKYGTEEAALTVTPNIIGPLLERTYPDDIQAAVRLFPSTILITLDGQNYQQNNALYADSTFFDVFSTTPLNGNLDDALASPNSVVLTFNTAEKYFMGEDPIGKILYSSLDSTAYTVRAVVSDPPDQSSFTYELIVPFHSQSWMSEEERFYPANYQTYVLFNNTDRATAVEARIPELLTIHAGEDAKDIAYQFQPLKDVHLKSTHLETSLGEARGDIRYVYIFAGLGLLILLIACINYINLTTARSVDRAREVGLRKVIGAKRQQVFFQFMAETFFIALIAIGIALGLVYIALPYFNILAQKQLSFSYLLTPNFIQLLVCILLLVSLMAGFYPALILSGFRPIRVLKGSFQRSKGGIGLRRGLVVFQFVISACLILGAISVHQQLAYIQQKKLGFDKDRILILPVDGKIRDKLEVFTNELMQYPAIQHLTVCTEAPHLIEGGYSLNKMGQTDEAQGYSVTAMGIDEHFIHSLDINLMTGSNFSHNEVEGESYVFLLNQTAVKNLGWEIDEAVGKMINLNGREGRIKGVIQDFHFSSMETPISSLVLYNSIEPWTRRQMLIKLAGGEISQHITSVESSFERLFVHRPFTYQFLDQEFDALYRSEQRTGKIATAFALLAVIIASLGLFGLASFTAVQRTKEIGIRKIMGATIPQIISLLAGEYLRLIVVAFIIAFPVGYYLIFQWLSTYAYRIPISALWFGMALLILLGIVLISIGQQTLKAARSNPVKALRYE